MTTNLRSLCPVCIDSNKFSSFLTSVLGNITILHFVKLVVTSLYSIFTCQNVAGHYTWKAFYHAWREKPFQGSTGLHLTNFSFWELYMLRKFKFGAKYVCPRSAKSKNLSKQSMYDRKNSLNLKSYIRRIEDTYVSKDLPF